MISNLSITFLGVFLAAAVNHFAGLIGLYIGSALLVAIAFAMQSRLKT